MERNKSRQIASPHRLTIGNLRSLHQLLEVGCDRCEHVVYVDPRVLALHGLMLVQDAYQRMRCSLCSHKPSYSRPDVRAIISD